MRVTKNLVDENGKLVLSDGRVIPSAETGQDMVLWRDRDKQVWWSPRVSASASDEPCVLCGRLIGTRNLYRHQRTKAVVCGDCVVLDSERPEVR